MEDKKDQWMEDVFHSMKGHQRAKPHPDLFAKIEHSIDETTSRIVPMNLWKYAVAAAVLLLCINIFALHQLQQRPNTNPPIVHEDAASNLSLISNYKIYE